MYDETNAEVKRWTRGDSVLPSLSPPSKPPIPKKKEVKQNKTSKKIL
jgi:hypothetical protein